jgi:hypothetical protein
LRFALAAGLVVGVAAVVAASAGALAFDDATPCRDTQPVFICPEGTVDSSYSITFISHGGCGPALPYQYRVVNGSLPSGLSLAPSGVLSGTPTGAGTARFWVELSDEDPPSQSWCNPPKKAEREFSITIHPRVLVTTESTAPGTIGAPYTLNLAAAMKSGPGSSNPPSSPLTWSLTQGQLPSGLALNSSSGAVTGTPTAEGSSSFTVRAALADGRSDTKGLTINVRQPLAITPSRPLGANALLTRWEVGVPFAAKLTGSGGTGTYTWTLASGSLPTGVTLGADGTVAGTTQTAGTYQATLRLSDTEGRTADYAANFIVAARLAVSTLALKPGKVGRLYRARVSATGGVVPKAWRIVRGPLPRGVRFDRTLGLLSGTPTKAGRYRVRFQVTDALKVVALKTLRIDVLAALKK